MSFSETIFLFFLALIIFGPKKLPEMAKQAGRLLAELRRASNEFKSQIETEISHLEVEKNQTVLPPSPTPPGAVASMSLNSASKETLPPTVEAAGTLAGPAGAPPIADSAAADSSASSATPSSSSAPGLEVAAEPNVGDPQESHV